jgi:hypothetical protein
VPQLVEAIVFRAAQALELVGLAVVFRLQAERPDLVARVANELHNTNKTERLPAVGHAHLGS